jgi:hypothetical protein
MTRSCRTAVLALVAAGALAAPAGAQPTLQASVGYGTILGTVRDTRGAALEGVLVSALGPTHAVAVTDKSGRFAFGNLPPGPYLLRAHLAGFVASPRELVQVQPNRQLVRTFALRPIAAASLGAARIDRLAAGPGELGLAPVDPNGSSEADAADEDHPHTLTAWRLRHLPRSVLRDRTGLAIPDDTAAAPDEETPWAPSNWLGWAVESSARLATALFTDVPWSAEVNLLTTSAFNAPQDLFTLERLPRGVAFFSIGAPAGRGQWSMRAALSPGEVTAWVVAGSYAGRARESHALDLGLSYSTQQYEPTRTPIIASVADHNRNAGAVYAFDTWQLARRLEVHYGARYARYAYLERQHLVSPELGVSLSPATGTYVRASVAQWAVAPGATEFLPPSAAGLWLPPERTFSPLEGGFRAERVRNLEIAVEHAFGDAYLVGLRRFYQRSSDQLVTLFGVSGSAGDTLGHYFVANAGAVDADGWGVRVSSPFAGRLRGSVDYSLTRARWNLSPETPAIGAVAPSAVRSESETIHDVTTAIEAAIPETATRVSLVYRLNSAFARPDGEAASPGFDARFDVQVNQALPFMRLVNSEWEMLVAVRSLFHDARTTGSLYDELLVVRPPKRIVGGFLVRF